MAPSELAEIRALLIAQTQTVDERRPPRLLGLVGSLLKPRGDASPPRPLNLSTMPAAAKPTAAVIPSARPAQHDACLPLGGEEIDPDLFEPLDLPPPPRAEFGVRSPRPYLPHDSVLLLNKRVPAQPRRLTLLTDTGEAVGEVYLTPDEAPARPIYTAADPGEDHQAPYFPGDLDEAETLASPAPVRVQTPVKPEPAPRPDKPQSPRASRSAVSARARPGLGHDLLHALALTLEREHEALCDRLLEPVTPFGGR